jgi:hypothetical protein
MTARRLSQRPAVLVDAHAGFAQRPVANDLAAALQFRFVRLVGWRARGLRRLARLRRAIDHGLTGLEHGARVGARRL